MASTATLVMRLTVTAMASMNAEALLELPKLLSVMLKLLIEMLEMAPMVAYALLQPLELPFPVG